MHRPERKSGKATEVDATGNRESPATVAIVYLRSRECHSGKSENSRRFGRGHLRSEKHATRIRRISRRVLRFEKATANLC